MKRTDYHVHTCTCGRRWACTAKECRTVKARDCFVCAEHR
jgi:hypothetical protein